MRGSAPAGKQKKKSQKTRVLHLVPSLVYLDQNALIGLGLRARKDQCFSDRLYGQIDARSVCIVVSPWHLVETAQTKNVESAIGLADFLDSLKPLWMHERRELQKLDVQEDYYRFLGIDFEITPRITTKEAVFAALFGRPPSPAFDIQSRDFAEQWIRNPEQLDTLKQSIGSNIVALERLRELASTGKITEELRKKVDSILVNSSLPEATPAGIEIGPELKSTYMEKVNIHTIPTFALELAISAHEWGENAVGKADRNTLIDKFHLISALAFVDEVVTEDHFFHAIYPTLVKSGHVRAVVVRTDELMNRF